MVRTTLLMLALVTSVSLAEDKAPQESKTPTTAKTPKVGTAVGNLVPHFKGEAWTFNGDKAVKQEFDSHKTTRATVYVFMSQTCPFCKVYQKRLAEMAKSYKAKGLDFVMVYPTRKTSQEKKVAYHKTAGFSGVFYNDKDASIAKALKVTKTPEVVLANAKRVITFRGGIDDNPRNADAVKKPHLKNAADATLAGKPVKVTTAPLYG